MNTVETLKAWRARAGLSQSKAAALLGIPLRTYEGIEQGRAFTYERLLTLAIQALENEHGA
jgi:DNA-binding XRE family transcriptional regulator